MTNDRVSIWDNLVKALGHVKEPDTEQRVLPLTPPSRWLPTDLKKFYRYYGSLTTPACDEVVVWTLFETPIPIGRRQVSFALSFWISAPERGEPRRDLVGFFG